MLQLRQLNLQFTLVGTGALGKDIENQAGTVEHPALNFTFNVALLTGCQCMVKNHQAHIVHTHRFSDFFNLALTNERFYMRYIPLGRYQIYRVSPRRDNEFTEFTQVLPVRSFGEVDVYEDGFFTTTVRTLKKHR